VCGMHILKEIVTKEKLSTELGTEPGISRSPEKTSKTLIYQLPTREFVFNM